MKGNAAPPSLALSSAPTERAPWVLAALGLLLLWFSFPTLRTLHGAWVLDVDYSHGYLVLALTAWLLMAEARRAPLAPFTPSWAGLTCLSVLILVTIAAFASTTRFVAAAALPALWIAALWAVAGAHNARRFALPIAYLYVAVPIWSGLLEPLRRLTVRIVTGWIRAADLPAYIDGNFIHVPSGTFEVQGGCAGLRYAIIAVALAAFSNLLSRRRWAPSAVLVAFALLLALVGNWIRVFVTVAVGQSEAHNLFTALVRDYHTLFGWLLFAVFMLPVFYLDRMLLSRSATSPAPLTVAAGAPQDWRAAGAYGVCVLLALGIWLNQRVVQGDDALQTSVALAPPEIPGWRRVERWDDARVPKYVGAAAETASWYADGAGVVGVYVAHYARQRQEHEVVFLGNLPAGQSGAVVAQRPVPMPKPSAAAMSFQELEVADSAAADRRLVWVGLRVAGEPARSSLAAKALQIVGAFRGRRDAQALVLTATCAGDCDQARSALSRYAAAAAEPFDEQAESYASARLVRADVMDATP